MAKGKKDFPGGRTEKKQQCYDGDKTRMIKVQEREV